MAKRHEHDNGGIRLLCLHLREALIRIHVHRQSLCDVTHIVFGFWLCFDALNEPRAASMWMRSHFAFMRCVSLHYHHMAYNGFRVRRLTAYVCCWHILFLYIKYHIYFQSEQAKHKATHSHTAIVPKIVHLAAGLSSFAYLVMLCVYVLCIDICTYDVRISLVNSACVSIWPVQ